MKPQAAIQLLRNTIRLKHYSLSTEQCYADWLSRFMRYVVKLPRGLPSEKKLEAFLTMLARDEVSASTQNQAFNAGQNPRAIQQAMGHKSLDTTMGYLHAEALSVRSPLDLTPSTFILQPS